MKKLLKGLLAVVVVIVVLLVLALASHPLWVGPTVKAVAGSVGPKYTGTPVVLTKCDVNLYSGHFEIAGFQLANPQGCSETSAVSLSTLKVDFDTLSALKDVVAVRSVEVSGLFLSYLKGASGKYNFTEIADNAKAASGGGTAEKKEGKPAEKSSSGKKVVIDRLSVGDVKVAAFGMKVSLLPGTIVLTDIGKKSNGATLADVWDQMSEQVVKASGATGEKLVAAWEFSEKYGKQGLELGKKGLDAGTEGVKKALDSVKNLDTKGAADALKNAGDSIKDVGNGLKGLFKK